MHRITRGALIAAGASLLATLASAADLEIPPARTKITFELGSTLHRVHGKAKLEEGSIQFDPEGGSASGRVVIDATSLDTDNGLRDGQMHEKVLESERFPTIELLPTTLLVEQVEPDQAQVVLVGTLRIHGGEWPIRVPATVEARGEDLQVRGSFVIPYVAWGMRDMSNFLLSVDPEVEVHFETLAHMTPTLASSGSAADGAPR